MTRMVFELEPLVSTGLVIDLKVHDRWFLLQTDNVHEKRYFLRYAFKLAYPQHDLDIMLISRFVREGDVVLDVGANIGLTAIEFLACGAKSIHAFEAVPHIADRLARLHSPEIRVYKNAVSDRTEVVSIYESSSHNQGSTLNLDTVSLLPNVFGESPKVHSVIAISINDIFGKNAGDIWKLDVEGAEDKILKGGSLALESNPPRIIILEWFYPLQRITDILCGKYECSRALIRKDNYSLELTKDFGKTDDAVYHPTAPMFVFELLKG